MPWRYAFIHFFGSLVFGSCLMTFLSFAVVNIYQGTFHYDGILLVFLLSNLYAFFLSIPGVGHLNLYWSRNFSLEEKDRFWGRFKRRYLLLVAFYIGGTTLVILGIFGFSYPAFSLMNAVKILPWTLIICVSYGSVGWLILSMLRSKLLSN